MENKKLFSIVLPIYKNEPNLPYTVPYIMENAPRLFPNYDVELIMVNDGSPDKSWLVMKEYQSEYPDNIRIARFVKNFGQGAAIHYGVSIASGDVIGVISADLQDPFELFADMLKLWESGSDLVCGVRTGRSERGIGRFLSQATHWMINRFLNEKYPKGGFDFFLMDRKIASRFARIEEKNGSTQLMLLSISSSTKFIPYNRSERLKGKSSWTLSKKIKYFIDTFVSNSYLPLRMMSVSGAICAMVAFVLSIIIIVQALVAQRSVPGWSSLAAFIAFFSGLNLMALGIIGEYLWRIYDAVKGTPLYIVEYDSRYE